MFRKAENVRSITRVKATLTPWKQFFQHRLRLTYCIPAGHTGKRKAEAKKVNVHVKETGRAQKCAGPWLLGYSGLPSFISLPIKEKESTHFHQAVSEKNFKGILA